MSTTLPFESIVEHGVERRSEAASRVFAALAHLGRCRLCAWLCDVDRSAAPAGRCHAGAEARFFSAQIEAGDELELLPVYALALSGCDIRCAFCITGESSWNAAKGRLLDVSAAAHRASVALESGAAKSVMLLGGEPAIHTPTLLRFVSEMPEWAQLVCKTNAHFSPAAREFLSGMFNVWVCDYKFGNDSCAEQLARVKNYVKVTQENLLWAACDADVIIRHVLLPGHVKCCWEPVAAWIGSELPDAKVSLRLGYWPAWHAEKAGLPARTILPEEAGRAQEIAAAHNLRLVP